MAIQLSIDKIIGSVVYVNVSGLPQGAKNLVVEVGIYDGTVNNITGTSAIVPVLVPVNGTYTVMCNYEAPYEQYDNYFFTPDVSTTVTVNNTNAVPPQSRYASNTVQASSQTSSSVNLPIISISIGVITVVILLMIHKKGERQ
ncbi:MAG: hypothetical protein QXV17_03500 [Candidatus Micrarchaeaceae archaeon]